MRILLPSPPAPLKFFAELHDALNSATLRFLHAPIILLGDFNFPIITWLVSKLATAGLNNEAVSFIILG